MAAVPPIVICRADGRFDAWKPSTLDQLGKHELFLEDAIVAQPSLLGLGSLRTGIEPPWKIFRRAALETPTGRSIEADVMLFCASGHIVIVEVKRACNPELRDRQVIAQLLDYATSVQALTDQNLLETFREGAASDWPSLVAQWFSDEPDADDLARHMLQRLERGEVHLVIACDRAPPGVAALVAALSRQAATGFELDLVEIVPYTSRSAPGEILLAPRPRLATEIVSRTAVTVEYRQTDARPGTQITTTSIDEIEERVRAERRGDPENYRDWTAAEIETQVIAANSPLLTRLFNFCKQHSYGGKIVAEGKKLNPTFGFNIPVRRETGSLGKMIVFNCNAYSDQIYLYFNFVERAVGRPTRDDFCARLKGTFGNAIQVERPEQYLGFDVLGPKIDDFEAIALWLKGQANALAAIDAT